jgi:hypothetical protein
MRHFQASGRRAWPCTKPGWPAPLPLLMRGMSGAAPAGAPRRRRLPARWRRCPSPTPRRPPRPRAGPSGGEVQLVGRMRPSAPCAAGPCTRRSRHAGPAQAGAAGGQHQAARTGRRRPAASRCSATGRRPAAASATRWPLCTSSPAPGGTSAGSPSTAGAGSCPARPRRQRPNCASNQARKVSDGRPSAGPASCLGERSVSMRAVVAQGPSSRRAPRRTAARPCP